MIFKLPKNVKHVFYKNENDFFSKLCQNNFKSVNFVFHAPTFSEPRRKIIEINKVDSKTFPITSSLIRPNGVKCVSVVCRSDSTNFSCLEMLFEKQPGRCSTEDVFPSDNFLPFFNVEEVRSNFSLSAFVLIFLSIVNSEWQDSNINDSNFCVHFIPSPPPKQIKLISNSL